MAGVALRAVPDSPPRAVLYLRQSVARDDSISIELQEIAGRDYCTAHGYTVVGVEVDEGISGRTWSKRPAVQRTMDLIERREADVIVLWKWSRLSRSRKDWALAADRVEVAGGRIESATEPIDTATASGRFARGVMTEYAAFQSEQIGEQWEEVRARRFSLGLPPNGAVPWGWTSRKTNIEFDKTLLRFLERAYEMYLGGSGWRAIAAWLTANGAPTRRGREWSPASVRAMLDSPIHAGYVEYRGAIRTGAHEAVIDAETWELYRHLRTTRSTPRKPRVSNYLLSTLVVCHCGRKRTGKRQVATSAAGAQRSSSFYACNGVVENHGPASISTAPVDAAVSSWIKSLPAQPDATAAPTVDIETETIAREITALEKQLVKLTEHLLSGLVPEVTYAQTKETLVARRTALSSEMERLQRTQAVSPAAFLHGREQLFETWDVLEIPDKQALLRSVVESVTIQKDRTIRISTLWGSTALIDT